MFGALKYLFAAFFIWAIGTLFFGSSNNFMARSEPAELRVVEMESQRDTDGDLRYRPIFELVDAAAGVAPYAGNIWTWPAPHEVGEIVPGRFDAETGQMRSDKMLQRGAWLGRIARYLAVFIALEGVAMIFGVPEDRLLLRVRVGHRRRSWSDRF